MLYYKFVGETSKLFSDRIKSELGAQKVCLCGKLDPMARGYTSILIDDDTKKMPDFLQSEKEYEFYLAIGISTDSDDILGYITDFQDGISDANRDVIKNFMIELKSIHKQQYHHYSAINIKKNNIRKPVWYWYKQNMLLDSDIPYKAIKVYNHQFIEKKTIDFKEYISYVLERLKKVKDVNFNVPKIIKSWKSLQVQKITMLKFRLTVSSGFYIRMISKELKSLGINTHIFDIHRTKVLD